MLPTGLSRVEEQRYIDDLTASLMARRERQRRRGTDEALARRADELARAHLDQPAGKRVRPDSVRWSDQQEKRWGSCSPDTGTIRISSRLRGVPAYVLDHVLLHELTHLVEASHSKRFHELAAHPQQERAEAFLAGWSAAVRFTTGEPGDAADVDG